MTNEDKRPEQDPAEGSRETIETELAKKPGPRKSTDAEKHMPSSQPGAEAAEPTPEQ